MKAVNPYLIFNGNCEEAFNMYRSIFGGEFTHSAKFKDMPREPEVIMSEEQMEGIMHISLPIGDSTTLMGSDSSEQFGTATVMGNNFSISVSSDSISESKEIFDKLSIGGAVELQFNKTFWGAHFGMLTDRFGIHWMINCEEKS